MSKRCWDNHEQFYRPDYSRDVDEMLQEFWSISFEDDVVVDENFQKLAGIRGKISLIDLKVTSTDLNMKKWLLNHFLKCFGGFYMSKLICLNDQKISFQSAVSSIRTSQKVYWGLQLAPIIALLEKGHSEVLSTFKPPQTIKNYAYCKRRGHLCK